LRVRICRATDSSANPGTINFDRAGRLQPTEGSIIHKNSPEGRTSVYTHRQPRRTAASDTLSLLIPLPRACSVAAHSTSEVSAVRSEGVCYCIMYHSFDSELFGTEGEALQAVWDCYVCAGQL
jgi:hypothetical protein